ncbi:glycosyl hydrolase 108 family protein [Mangrovicella endophytica]|uniref:glycosyl hydrolase 108 family protein n=1 Tax=Mangrovicella endophytica TaxID=2066697 RepID=UPI001FDEFBB2|nr:glycosyl hydrolase 108 family protein [Mangrovicella endophytica]
MGGCWADHPADPGGKTTYGITEAAFDAWLAAKGALSRQSARSRVLRPWRSISQSTGCEPGA